MALQFITGCSGSGKSYYVYENIIREAMENPDKNYLLIVPEQFTLQTQKDIVEFHPDKGIINIDVLSLNRLAYRVFDELGMSVGQALADTGKNMVLRKIIETHKDELGVFGRNYNKQGFVSEIKSFISEMYQYSVKPSDIEEFIEKNSDNKSLNMKLAQIAVIYKSFREYLQDKYITAEELLDILASVVEKSSIVKNSIIYMDGFTGFTPSQMNIMRQIISLSDKTYITLTLDPKVKIHKETSLFYMSYKTKERLIKLSESIGVKVMTDIVVSQEKELGYEIRYVNGKEIGFLEKQMFRIPRKAYEDETDNIVICSMTDKKQECLYVVDEITKLVSEGYRYDDIAIVCGDMDSYGELLATGMNSKNIPCFVDYKKKVNDNLYVGLLKSIYDIVKNNYRSDCMFKFIRNRLTQIDADSADILENYVISAGINYEARWKKEWKKKYRYDYSQRLPQINEIRKNVVEKLEGITTLFPKSATVNEYADASIEISKRLNCELLLAQLADKFASENNYVLEKEYSKIYSQVMELFEQMKLLLNNVKVTLDEFIKIFEAGIAEIKIGVIPQVDDQIVVGDIERTRLNNKKVLFMVGTNDGVIPKNTSSVGVLSDIERERLSQMGFELAPTRRQAAFIGQFYLYINITKPSEKIYISYSLYGDSKPIKESYIINQIMGIFPKTKIISKTDKYREGGKDYLFECLSNRDKYPLTSNWSEVLSWNMKKDENKKIINMAADAVFNEGADKNLAEDIINNLYENSNYSVSRIEQFSSCAYAHFLSYGMGLRQRDEYEIKVPDMGNLFHKALDNYASILREKGLRWDEISKEFSDELMDRCMDIAIEEYENGILLETKRNMFKVRQIKRVAKRTGWVLCRHVEKGKFSPAGFEVRFVKNVDENSDSIIKGTIDRVDTCVLVDNSDHEDDTLVKVIDYKSGDKSFESALFKEGISMQLIVYMDCAIEMLNKMGKNAVPAGAFYFRFSDPVIDMNKDYVDEDSDGNIIGYNESLIEEGIIDKMKMKGLVNCDKSIISAVDGFAEVDNDKVKSSVMNIKTDEKAQSKMAGVGLTDTDTFKMLMKHSSETIKECDRQIKQGKIERNPYRYMGKSTCDYCEYADVCRFDISNGIDKYRDIEPMKFKDLCSELKGVEDEVDDTTE